MKLPLYLSLALLVLTPGMPGQSPPPAKTTVFALVKEGDKAIKPQSKDKITQIHSDKSTGGLVPDVWYIDYNDPTAAFKTTEVTFVAGKITGIKQPKRVFDAFTGSKQVEWKRVKVDSDRALAAALNEPQLKKLDLRASQFWLERTPTGATWKIRFWTAGPDKPDQTTSIGDLYISAKSAEIIKTDLHIR